MEVYNVMIKCYRGIVITWTNRGQFKNFYNNELAFPYHIHTRSKYKDLL